MSMSEQTIIQGDCLEVMKTFADKSFDLVLTDPPYGIGMDEGFGGVSKQGVAWRKYDVKFDDNRPSKEVFDEMLRVGKCVVIFGGNYFADILPRATHWLFWDKVQLMPSFGDGELIWTNDKKKSVKKIVHQWSGYHTDEHYRFHPSQKPLEVMKKLIAMFSETGGVLDPFMGSGTTLVAAKYLNRNATGIEISEKYCTVARNRLAQQMLF